MILINSSPNNRKSGLVLMDAFSRPLVPVGIGYLLAVAEREGIRAEFIDEQAENDVIGLVRKYIKEMTPPYIFGFSVFTPTFKSAILRSKELKELYPDSIILFGGIHPTAVPEEVLSFDHVDLVLRGESEEVLPKLYRDIKAGRDYTYLKGLSFRRDGQIVHNERGPAIKDLDSLPPFPYHLFNPKQYDLNFVVSSRGCPHKCIFCSNRVATGVAYRIRSAKPIVDNLYLLYHKYGQRHIHFLDDNFLVNRKRIYTLLEEIKKRGLSGKITFSFQARGDNVDYQLLKDMYDTGFNSIYFGLETASERLMKVINKGETVEQCAKAVRMAKDIGFSIVATYIYAFPTETHKDRMDCVRMGKELNIDLVKFNNATPYPGTVLNDIAKRENRLNIQGLYENFYTISAFAESPFKKIPFSYVPEGNTEEEIRNDILYSHYAFYLDINKIRNIFRLPTKGLNFEFEAGRTVIALLKDFFKKLPGILSVGLMLLIKFVQLFFDILMRRNTSLSMRDFIRLFTGFKKV